MICGCNQPRIPGIPAHRVRNAFIWFLKMLLDLMRKCRGESVGGRMREVEEGGGGERRRKD